MLTCLVFIGTAAAAWATDVNVIGLTSGKAVISVNGGKPRTLSAGQTSPEGVKLLNADSSGAVIEVDGKTKPVTLGQSISTAASTGRASVVLQANGQGHFETTGVINGASTRVLVDTGATTVAMSSAEARRMGINFLHGQRIMMSTANGIAPAYRVVLDTVRVGDLTLNQVEGTVLDGQGLPVTLLGMSFLSRVEMKREGTSLTLTKGY